MRISLIVALVAILFARSANATPGATAGAFVFGVSAAVGLAVEVTVIGAVPVIGASDAIGTSRIAVRWKRQLNPAIHVDHRNPRAKGGSDSEENLQLTAAEFNLKKGALTDNELRSAKWSFCPA